MARDEGAPIGAFALSRRTREVEAARIAARAAEVAEAPGAEGVLPLNAGFFHLERMRQAQGAKSRDAQPAKVRGGR
ncbi:MAG TPA: hypothetical protein VIS77_05140 [Burkholderiales bacterium]